MVKMFQELTIGSLKLSSVKRVELESARTVPVDILKIYLPKIKGYDKSMINVDDAVSWASGYTQYGMVTEFEGTVYDVSPKQPLEITCKDEMHKLQKKFIQQNFYNVTIQQFLSSVAPGYTVVYHDNCDSIFIRVHETRGRSAAWALDMLKYSKINIFFRGKTLHVVRPYHLRAPEKPKKFKVNFNIIEDNIASRSEKKQKIKVISYDPDSGKPNDGTYGVTGDEKIIQIDGLDTKGCKEKAEEIWKEQCGEGLSGDFVTFGFPSVQKAEYIQVIDDQDKLRTREAFVDSVKKIYDAENASYRQTIELAVVR
jgi:hypothetical protein